MSFSSPPPASNEPKKEPTIDKNDNDNGVDQLNKEPGTPESGVDESTLVAQKKIEELEGKLKEQESKYSYLYADFDNYKKRVIKERADLLKFGWEAPARDLLQVLDNLERGLAHAPAGTDKALTQGLEMVVSQFKGILEKQGIQTVTSLGKPFDPNYGEAVAQEPSDQPSGTVIREHSPGYTLHGRLLRPARVVVSSGKEGGG
ncbi:MAG: nucleotide exchange factor GrpE [Bdellovibrionales bacterium GWB1_55_8]|nr:MAG: nucleotide exchange factor GrpE [Bdellovibrionales bacterium GWB1_55_8]